MRYFKKNKLLKKIKPNYDYVVNLAGYVDHSHKVKTMKSHYVGFKNLTHLFLNTKIKKFVQIGSSVEYGKIKSPQHERNSDNKTFSIYGRAKLLSTSYHKAYIKDLIFQLRFKTLFSLWTIPRYK